MPSRGSQAGRIELDIAEWFAWQLRVADTRYHWQAEADLAVSRAEAGQNRLMGISLFFTAAAEKSD